MSKQPSFRRIRAIGLAMVLFGPETFAQPQFRNAGAILVAETITNRVIEPGERVTVSLALKNVGNQTASNLVGTIRSGSAVFAPAPRSHSYGVLSPGGSWVAREFEFTANAPNGSLLLVNLDATDSGRYLGTVTFRFRIGPHITWAVNAAPVSINDQNTATPYPSIISVSNVPGSIIDVSVTLSNLWHTFPDDLDVLLVSPGGQSVLLMSDACGTSDLDYRDFTFTDQSPNVLPNQGFAKWSVVRPTNYMMGDQFPLPAPAAPYGSLMSAFNGGTANGDWKLFILDDSAGDNGSLARGWALNIVTLQKIDAAATLTLLGRTNNTITVAVSGWPYNSYAIETSSNLVQFSSARKAFIIPASGVLTFEFPLEPMRFFRAATDP